MSNKLETFKEYFKLTQVGSRSFISCGCDSLAYEESDKLKPYRDERDVLTYSKSDYDYIAVGEHLLSLDNFMKEKQMFLQYVEVENDSYIKGCLKQFSYYENGDKYQITVLDKLSYYKQCTNNRIVFWYLRNISAIRFALIKDLKYRYINNVSGTVFFYALLYNILGTKKYNNHANICGDVTKHPSGNVDSFMKELEAIFDLDC